LKIGTIQNAKARTYNPSYSGADIRRIMVQSQPGQIVCEMLPQKYPTHKKRNDGATQVVEYLPSKCEDLSLNPTTTKKKKITRAICQNLGLIFDKLPSHSFANIPYGTFYTYLVSSLPKSFACRVRH
jgi:hypothetical protein